MPHTLEQAPTGRAKCRGCGQPIARGEWRLGEAVANPFADEEGAETLHWYHPVCSAYKRPEVFLAVLPAATVSIAQAEVLEAAARLGVEHHRVVRLDHAERAATGRAACRACKAPIEKGSWRLALVFYEDGRFAPSGFLHLACAAEYLGTRDVMDRIRHFTPALSAAEFEEIRQGLGRVP